MKRFAAPADLLAEIGQPLGTSGWHRVDQSMIDAFAELSGDHQWIHRAGPQADGGPYGAPIAHGFLTLSLLFPMLDEVFQVGGVDLVLNKGLDRLRLTSPVPAGARVRAKALLVAARARPRDFTEVTLGVTVEIEGQTRPAYTVDSLILYRASGSRPVAVTVEGRACREGSRSPRLRARRPPV